jgi:hypothetical protein
MKLLFGLGLKTKIRFGFGLGFGLGLGLGLGLGHPVSKYQRKFRPFFEGLEGFRRS